jgi:hypothetical protein
MSKTKLVIIILLIIGFACMEFPGVFFFKNTIDPFIFGLPFIYGYILIFWALMCIVLLFAYLKNWGEEPAEAEKRTEAKKGGEK